MLDHISIGIRDFERGLAFYDVAMKTLGYARNMTFDRAAGYGRPNPRPEYHPNYYAAFVIDPDGHHLEAVRHKPE